MAVFPHINITGLNRLRRKLEKVELLFKLHAAVYDEIGQYALFKIKKRTSEGEDVDGDYFIPYSKRYSFFRQKHGRPTNKVDLFFTGSMMSAMDYETQGLQIILYFLNTTDSSNVRNPLKAFFLNEKRNFFALSDEDVKGIEDIVNRNIKNLLR